MPTEPLVVVRNGVERILQAVSVVASVAPVAEEQQFFLLAAAANDAHLPVAVVRGRRGGRR